MTKTVFITGSSTGIGKATAKFFHEKGWNVVATMRKPEQETELTKLSNVLVTKLDVLNEDTIDAAFDAGINEFGSVDVLVNNAGYSAFGVFEATPKASIRRQYHTNVLGVVNLMYKFIPYFRKQNQGIIINISSIAGKVAFPFFALYASTKFAVEGLTEGLKYELANTGVIVKLIEPGFIKTDFYDRSIDKANDESLTEYQGLLTQMNTSVAAGVENIAVGPEIVAEAIYTAATDNTTTLRYLVGEDAKQMGALRKTVSDEDLMDTMRKNLGLL